MIFINRFPYIVFNMNGTITFYRSHDILDMVDKKDTPINGEIF